MWLRNVFMPSSCVGLAIGAGSIEMAHCRQRRRGSDILWHERFPLDTSLVFNASYSALGSALDESLGALGDRLGKRGVPIQVALPDPVVNSHFFVIEEWPRTAAAQGEFVRWQMGKLFCRKAEEMACAHQWMGQEGGRHFVFAVGTDRALVEAIREAFVRRRRILATVDMAACYRFNRLPEELKGQSGALVAIEPDYWSGFVWDATGRLRCVRARWRTPDRAREREEWEKMAADFERLVRGYVHEESGRRIERLYLSGEKDSVDAVGDVLGSQGVSDWGYLPPEARMGQNGASEYLPGVAVAACSCR